MPIPTSLTRRLVAIVNTLPTQGSYTVSYSKSNGIESRPGEHHCVLFCILHDIILLRISIMSWRIQHGKQRCYSDSDYIPFLLEYATVQLLWICKAFTIATSLRVGHAEIGVIGVIPVLSPHDRQDRTARDLCRHCVPRVWYSHWR